MSQGNMCRLCVDICEEYKSLYDESDNAKEVLQLMIHYFDQELFTGNKFNVMCMQCWEQISDFNSFQQSVYRAQRILLMKDEKLDVSEEEFLPEDNIDGSYNDGNIFLISDSETVDVSSSSDSYKTDVDVMYDGPVGVFIGGEFSSAENSTELPLAAALDAECHEALTMQDKPSGSISQNLVMSEGYMLAVKASDDLIAQWTPVLECIFCSETCSTYSLLEHHFQDKHLLFNCQARCCGKNYACRAKYEDHIRMHLDSNSCVCTFCGRQHKCQRTLNCHIREYHPSSIEDTVNPSDDSDIVSVSSKKVTEISTESIPTNVGEFKLCRTKYIKETDEFIAKMRPTLNCYLCSEKYSTFSLFRHHFSEKHPQDQCYITCCQRKLTARFRVLEHLQLHVNPDVFKCEVCEMRHRSRYQLQMHMRKRHTTSIKDKAKPSKKKNMSDKRYQKSDELLSKWLPSTECPVCKKAFATLTLLQCHFMESHPDDIFHVECCQQKLQTRCKIEAHVRYHIEPAGFKCELCYVYYRRESSLNNHNLSVH